MSRRGGGDGGDFPMEQHPPAAHRGGGRRGRGVRGGRGRRRAGDTSGGGDGGEGVGVAAAPSTMTGQRAPLPTTSTISYSHPPADTSSSAAASAGPSSSRSQALERRLKISDPAVAEPEAALLPKLPPASSRALRHPARPGFGTVGRRCVVRANHFLVEVADRDLCHYDVAISPESKSKVINRRVITELVRLHKDGILGSRLPTYDGRKSLYTGGPLPFTVKDFMVKFPDEEKENKARKDKEFKVTIKFAGKADVQHLREFLSGRQMDVPQETIQVLDIVLRESPSTNYVTVSRSFFSPMFGHKREVGEGLECWRGYFQSLRPTQMGLSLNTDISATSFYKPVLVVEFVAEHLNIRDTARPLSDTDRIKVKKTLRGIKVEAIHRASRRRYKITGITAERTSQLIFPVDEQGTKMSVMQYFQERYNYSLKHISWPCLQAGSDTRPIYLPMEVCKIVDGQRFTKKLNDRQVTSILKATCQRPRERERSILEVVHMNNFNNDKFAKEFGIRMKNELALVEARVLPPPRLKYHESGREKSCHPNVGQWNMINKKMVNGGNVEFWTCLNFSSRLRQDQLYQFCNDLVGMCNNIGMVFNPSPFIDIRTVQHDCVESGLREVYNRSTERLKHIQLLVVVLPEMSGYYGRIKRICETELGIVSQCCLPKNVFKAQKQYLENVALKINVKVGGRNTVLEDALHDGIPLVTDMPTIIFGADVTHPPPGEDTSSSIAAVVASVDWPEVTKYKGLVSAQQCREEIVQDLFKVTQDAQRGIVYGGMIRELLLSFYRATDQKPHRIIFYRDGVSEGQFNQVLLHEVTAIRKACASLEEGYLPPVTFVVVQKRHHTRLFPEFRRGSPSLTDISGNILPGTVVDKMICHPTGFDFFLCSHAGIQGTSRPTHYHVLFDENHFSADELQTLTNNLCYTYARCTRSVSVVPPAYYAHLAASRARHYYMESRLSDGGSTPAPVTVIKDRSAEVTQLPPVKDNVKEVMFYC